MASRTSTDPLEILVEMGVDLDNLSEEEDYLSALIETTNALTIKSASDPRIRILQQEIRKVRQKRKAADTKFKARKTKISASKLTNKTSAPAQRKQMSSTTFFALPPATDQKKEEKKKGSPPNLLKEIAETTTRIADILKDQYDLKRDTATFDRKKAEREKRDLQKKNLAKRFEGLKKVAEKIIAPVRGIFDRIMGFLFNILLGKFLMKLVDWFSNPDNKSKINSIIRFLSNNWPKLLSAYIIFGTGLGKFSRFIVKILARGAIRLAAATAGLLARLFGSRALGKFSRFFGRRGKLIAGGIEAVSTIVAFKALEGALTKGLGPEESASIDNDIPVSGYSGGGLVQPIFKFSGGGKVNLNLISPIGYNEGGEVDGPSGTDQVPAMLTDGEFVMSRGAVQKFGVGQLEAMNAAGGGTNVPKVMNGTVYAANGGRIGGGPMFPERRSDDVGDKGFFPSVLNSILENRHLNQIAEVRKFKQGLIEKGFLNQRGRLEGASRMQAYNMLSDLLPTIGAPQNMANLARSEEILSSIGLSRDSNIFGADGANLSDVFYGGKTTGINQAYEVGAPQVNKMSEESLALYMEQVKRLRDSGQLKQGMMIKPYGIVDKTDPRYREQGGLRFYVDPNSGQGYLADTYGFDPDDVKLGPNEVDYQKQVEAFQNPNTPIGKVANFFDLKPTKDATEGGGIVQLILSMRNKIRGYDPAEEMRKKAEAEARGETYVPKRMKTKLQLEVLENLGDLRSIAESSLTPSQAAAIKKAEEARVLEEKQRKNEEALMAKRPWYDKLGLLGGASAVMHAEQRKERDDLLKGMTESQRKLFRDGGGFAALAKGKTLDQIYAGGQLAQKPEREKERQSMMAMLMGGEDAYYASTTGRYYKNYAEALKDPKVAAAAEVEKFKQQFSFSPSANQQPNITIPGMPTTGSNGSNVTVIKTSSKDKSPSGNTGGSEVPNANPGQGNRGKWNILGMSIPALF